MAPAGDEWASRVRTAVEQLTDIAGTVNDHDLRRRLERVCDQLAGPAVRRDARTPLSPRELEAVRLVAVGATNAEIASRMRLTQQTVKAYLRSAMRKLGVHNRSAAVHAAREAGQL